MINVKAVKSYICSDCWYKVIVSDTKVTVYKLGEPLFQLSLADFDRIYEMIEAAVMQRHLDENEY